MAAVPEEEPPFGEAAWDEVAWGLDRGVDLFFDEDDGAVDDGAVWDTEPDPIDWDPDEE
ncbi:hypothetical protein [Thermaerobacter litoralis]